MTASSVLRAGLSIDFTVLDATLIAILGASWGSFLNAFGHRLLLRPRGVADSGSSIGLSLNDRSECFHCKAKISPMDLVPILSFFLLFGRARCCGRRIPYIYLISEIIFLALFLLIIIQVSSLILVIAAVGIFSTLYLLTLSDINCLEVPIYLIFLLLIFVSIWIAHSPGILYQQVIMSALFGFIILFIPGLVVSTLMQRSSLGIADPIIFSILSATLALDMVPYFLIMSASIGIIFSLRVNKIRKIPFVPSISFSFFLLWAKFYLLI